MWLPELRLCCRPTVPAKTGLPRSGDRRYHLCLLVNAADNMAGHIDEVQIAGSVKTDLVWLIDFGLKGRTIIPGVSLFSRPDDCRDLLSLEIDPPDNMIVDLAEIEPTIRSHDQAVWIIHAGVVKTWLSGSDQGRDSLSR